MRGLSGKKVWITGANAGIGLATAKRFQEEGSELTLIDLAFSKDTKNAFPDATFIAADLSQAESISECDNRMSELGIDVLINNAGITRDASLLKMTDEAWDAVIAVNLKAVFKMGQAAAGYMKAQKSGVILNAASVVAHYGNFGQSNYVAAKAGVIGMTKTWSKELGKYGVRVNALAPGFIMTQMVMDMPQAIRAGIAERPALKRMGQVEEMASVYAFLASDDASYITGTVIQADGGLVLG